MQLHNTCISFKIGSNILKMAVHMCTKSRSTGKTLPHDFGQELSDPCQYCMCSANYYKMHS